MSADQMTQREKNTFWISLITGSILGIVTIITLFATIQSGLYAFLGIIVTAAASIAAFLSAWYSRKHRSELGGAIFIGTTLVISLSLPVMAKGQGIVLAVMVALMVASIASAILSPTWAGRATVAAIIVGIAITLVDLYTPSGFGTPTDPRYTLPIAAIISFVCLVFLGLRFRRFSLRTQFIIAFLNVAVIPLAFLGYQSYQNASKMISEGTNTALLRTATLAADTVDAFIRTQLDTIRTEAQITDLVEYLALPSEKRQGSPKEDRAREILQALHRKDQVYISSYALLDRGGVDVLDTFVDDIGLPKTDRDYFLNAIDPGSPYVSQVTGSLTEGTPSIYFSAPVRDQNGEIVGVLRARYYASVLQGLLHDVLREDSSSIFAALVDSEFHVYLAHTDNTSLNFTGYASLTPEEAQQLQNRGRLASGDYESVVIPRPETAKAIENIDNNPTFTAPATAAGGADLLSAGKRLKNQSNWVVMVREPVEIAFQPILEQTRGTILFSLLMAGLATAAAYFFSQFLSAPITQLTNIAQRVAGGDLSARAQARSQDEIGILATTFNSMTNQLRQTLEGLEQRVQERTIEMEQANVLTQRRAEELQAISEISRAIASEQNIDRLLPLITQLVSERFGYYHVGIFLNDEMQVYAVLRATNSEGGQRMLGRNHKLEIGQEGIVGFVARQGHPRISLDVGSDAAYFNNPYLPSTRSEMALPLQLRGRTIGVLDVQSTEPSAFTQADANTLSILADQVAIAIENARLFGETQRALSEAQELYRQFVSQKWEKSTTSKQVGYIRSLTSGKAIEQPIQTEEIRQAVSKGELVISAGAPEKTRSDQGQPTIAVPIKLHDQVIGVLNISTPEKNREWNEHELALAQAISDRIALALENARLLEDSQRRASRERAISEISSKLSTITDIDAVLRSTVEELGKTLGKAEVAIQIQNTNEAKG